MIDPTQTVATVVLDHSSCAEVFQRHRIDFCCRGEQSVAAAAQSKGLDVATLVGELVLAAEARRSAAPDPRELSTARLVAHIVATHHEYLRATLPLVCELAQKVRDVHGDHDPRLHDLAAAVDELSAALLPHLDEEETSIFPALQGTTTDRDEVARLVASMTEDHHEVAAVLERIHAASDGLTLPDWACTSYRTLFARLQDVERDIHTHVHLENHVLAPRFAS